MNSNLITLIIPCYNVEQYIDRCMQSVEEQTLGIENFQIILIDDASTDNTLDHLIRWQAKYPYQIQIIHHEVNKRQGTCRNIGMKCARGEYIAFLDADDWVEPDMYEKLLQVAQIGECEVVQCENSKDTEFKYWTALREKYTGKIDRLIQIDTDEDRGNMLASNLLGTYVVTKIYRRDFLEACMLRFPENLLFEDIFWMSLLNCYVSRIGIVEERLYHYFMNPNSVSRVRNREQNHDICEVNRLLWKEYEERGLLNAGFYRALEYEFLCTYYLTAVKMCFLRYDEIPFDMFYEAQADVMERIPHFASNPYIETYTTPFNKLLIGILDKDLSKEEIESAANSMRTLAHSESTIDILK